MPLQYTCLVCGKTFKVAPSRVRRGDPLKFCSAACYHQDRAHSHIDIPCATCGRIIHAGRIDVPPHRKYCSQECYDRKRKERHAARLEEQAPRKRVASTTTCVSCGTEFKARPSELAKGKRFCSFACRDAESREKRQRCCEICGQLYMADKGNQPSRFCSITCRVASRTKPADHFRCLYCASEVVRRAGRKQGQFCSVSCASAWRVRHTAAGFKPALRRLTPRKPYEKPGYQKKATAVRKRDGYQCQQCGRQWKRGMRTFEVHHIIPIRLGGLDTMDNLITLCPRCHRRTDLALRTT